MAGRKKSGMKKMIMAVIPHDHTTEVLDALVDSGYTATYGESRGGMLRQSQHSLFIALAEEQIEDALSLIREHCRSVSRVEKKEKDENRSIGSKPVTTDLGGAVVFVWDIERIETY
jgi:uncharacterized protein YaaQ